MPDDDVPDGRSGIDVIDPPQRVVRRRRRRSPLRAALRAGGFGTWRFDGRTGRLRLDRLTRELCGLPDLARDLTLDDAASLVSIDEKDRLRMEFLAAVRAGRPYDAEVELTLPAGGTRWLSFRGRPVGRQGRQFVGLVWDITARKRAAEGLAQRVAELQSLYASAPVGLALFDEDLRFVRVTARLAEINRAPPEAHLGRRLTQLHAGHGDLAESLIAQVLRTGVPLLDVQIEDPDVFDPGLARSYLCSYGPVAGPDGLIGVQAVVQDVTPLRAAERRQAQLLDELNHRVKNSLAVVQTVAMRMLAERAPPREVKGTAQLTFGPAGTSYRLDALLANIRA